MEHDSSRGLEGLSPRRVEVVEDLEEFAELGPDWDQLYASTGTNNLFLTHAWQLLWMRHFGGRGLLALLRRDAMGRLTAAAAFVRRRWHAGTPQPHSYLFGLLAGQGEAEPLEDFLSALRSDLSTHAARMSVCDDLPGFRQGCERAGLITRTRAVWQSRSLDTRGSFSAYLETRDSHVRHELQRKQRKIQRAFQRVELREYSGVEQAELAWPAIEAIENASWKFREGTAIINDDAERSFYRELLSYAPDSETRSLSFVLHLDDRPAAFVLGVVHRGCYYALKTSFVGELSRYSPGQVVMSSMIRALFENHETIVSLEFLGSDARWKRELATDAVECREFALYWKSLPSLTFALVAEILRPAARRISHSTVAPIRYMVGRRG